VKNLLLLLTIFIFLFFIHPASGNQTPVVFTIFEETIDVQNTGAALITWQISPQACSRNQLDLPFNYAWGEGIDATFLEKTAAIQTSLQQIEGLDYLRVTTQAAFANDTFSISFRDPAYLLFRDAGPGAYGLFRWKSYYLNTSRIQYETFIMNIILPNNYTLHSIEKSLPSYTKKDPKPPWNITSYMDRSKLTLQAKQVTLGSRIGVSYGFVKNQFPWLALICCLLLAAIHLSVFRDMLKEKGESSENR
jgi:hypothetical protein